MADVSSKVSNQRIDWVDAAKGLGIILVVFGHVSRGVFNAGMYDDEAAYSLIDNIIYSFHMPLFFFLSGLFFVRSFNKRGSGLILNKIDTIFYAYIVWSLIQGFMEVFMSNYANGSVTLKDVLVLLWHPRAQFWFLYTLFFVFIFNIAISMLLKKINYLQICVWIMVAISMVLLLIKPYLPGYFVVQSLASYDIYFCIGVLFVNVIHDTKIGGVIAASILIVFVSFEYLINVNGMVSVNSVYLKLTLAVLGLFSIVVVCQNTGGFVNRALSYIGIFSMEIYLMHVIFGSGFRAVMQKILHVDGLAFHLIGGTIIGIFLPILFAKALHTLKFDFLFKPPSILSVGEFGNKGG